MNTSILFSIDIETSNKEVLAIIAIKTNRVKIDKHQLPFECRKGKLASLLKDLAKSHIEYTQQYKKKVSPYSGWLIPLKKA